MAVSEVAKASNAALRAMLSQEHGSEGAVLDAWLTLSHHKVMSNPPSATMLVADDH